MAGPGDRVYLHDCGEVKSQEVMASLSKKQHDDGGRSFQVERNQDDFIVAALLQPGLARGDKALQGKQGASASRWDPTGCAHSRRRPGHRPHKT